MKIQRPKLKHCSHVYSDNKVFQSGKKPSSFMEEWKLLARYSEKVNLPLLGSADSKDEFAK